MKVLVTGGAGFIGSHACLELLKANHKIHIIDDFSTGSMQTIDRLIQISGKDIPYTKQNILDTPKIIKIFKKFQPDVVIHFAGFKSVAESISNPVAYYKNNISGSISLLDAMSQTKCNKIIFSSSATVYGKPDYLPIDENHKTKPKNPYGHSKLMVEKIIKDWTKNDDKRGSVILRYFNPVGAHKSGLHGEYVKGVPNNLMPFLSQVCAGIHDSINIYGNDYDTEDGTGKRDYIHILDLATAHAKSINFLDVNKGFSIFNIGTGIAYSVLEMIDVMEKVTNTKIQTKVCERRNGDFAEVWADPTNANERLSWKAKFNINDMCLDAWNWQIKSFDQK